jgi:hypothetical protein
VSECTFFHFFDFFDFFSPLSSLSHESKVHQKKKTRSPARHRPPLVTRARAHYNKRECEGDRFFCVDDDDDE